MQTIFTRCITLWCSLHKEPGPLWDNDAAQAYLCLRSAASCQNCIFLDGQWAKTQHPFFFFSKSFFLSCCELPVLSAQWYSRRIKWDVPYALASWRHLANAHLTRIVLWLCVITGNNLHSAHIISSNTQPDSVLLWLVTLCWIDLSNVNAGCFLLGLAGV